MTTLRKPLSAAQESRLIRHLDPALLSLSGSFESRHSPSSRLPTLSSFLDALVPLLSLVAAIPAAKPSGGLRVAYLLQLLGYLGPAIEGYPLDDDALDDLIATIHKFDLVSSVVLEGKEWDSSTGRAKEESAQGEDDQVYAVQALRNTDVVRLKSFVQDLRQVLSSSLDLPEFVPLSINPFEQGLGVDVRGRFGPDEEMEQTPELSMGEETEEDDSMSIDTVQAANGQDEDAEEEASDGEFEAVEIVTSPNSRFSHSSLPTFDDGEENETYVSPSSDPEDGPTSFEIHFNGPPPPTLTDGEITINQGQTPIVGQSKGFDPDEEFPLEDERDDEVQSGGGDDGSARREIREKLRTMFARTDEALKRLEAEREPSNG
ncbi:hypothetical protein JCM16303_000613 [Sporobolomyces ruberrimus]